jgi:hypothetical protein
MLTENRRHHALLDQALASRMSFRARNARYLTREIGEQIPCCAG